MSELRDLHEQITNIENMLVKKKLDYLVATKESDEIDMTDKRAFLEDDLAMLMDRMKHGGLFEGTGYIKYRDEFDMDEFADVVLMKINGQTFQFCTERGNIFIPFATDEPGRNTDTLIDIDLDELLQIDSQTLQDTSISELYAQLAEKKAALMKLKLARKTSSETIKNQRGGNAVITMEQLSGLIANVPEEEVEKVKAYMDSQMKSREESQKDEWARFDEREEC